MIYYYAYNTTVDIYHVMFRCRAYYLSNVNLNVTQSHNMEVD